MNILKLTSQLLSSNCYIVISDDKAAVIDPSIEPKIIIEKIKVYNCVIDKIIYTHAHMDHIIYGDDLKALTGAQIYAHPDDWLLYKDEYKNGAILFGMHKTFNENDINLIDKMVLKHGNVDLNIIHTPGHTMGCICIKAENFVFTGDTIFYESIGRTDLSTGDADLLFDSIKNKLFTLPDETIILPGHGIKTTITHEKENNPYVY